MGNKSIFTWIILEQYVLIIIVALGKHGWGIFYKNSSFNNEEWLISNGVKYFMEITTWKKIMFLYLAIKVLAFGAHAWFET